MVTNARRGYFIEVSATMHRKGWTKSCRTGRGGRKRGYQYTNFAARTCGRPGYGLATVNARADRERERCPWFCTSTGVKRTSAITGSGRWASRIT